MCQKIIHWALKGKIATLTNVWGGKVYPQPHCSGSWRACTYSFWTTKKKIDALNNFLKLVLRIKHTAVSEDQCRSYEPRPRSWKQTTHYVMRAVGIIQINLTAHCVEVFKVWGLQAASYRSLQKLLLVMRRNTIKKELRQGSHVAIPWVSPVS